jgi:hypothetical protein
MKEIVNNLDDFKIESINAIVNKLFYIISSYETLYQKLLQEKADDVKIAKDIVDDFLDIYKEC